MTEISELLEYWKSNVEESEYLCSQGNTGGLLNVPVSHMKKFIGHISSLEAENAKLKALIEKLVEAGEGLTDFILIDTRSDEEKWRKWIEVRDEWQAMKGGAK